MLRQKKACFIQELPWHCNGLLLRHLHTPLCCEEGEVPISLPLHSQGTVPLPTYKSSFANSDPWKQTISLATNWHHTSAAELVPEEPNTCLNVSALILQVFA